MRPRTPFGSKKNSEDEEIGERVAGVKAANGLGQKWRHRKGIHLGLRHRRAESEGGYRVGDNDAIDGRIHERGFCPRHEQAMRHQRQNTPRAGLPRGAGGAYERAAGADEIVDDERGRPVRLTDEELARYNSRAAALIDEGLADAASKRGL